MLRNVKMTAPYFHDGSVKELIAAVRIMGQLQLSLQVNDKQSREIVAFLKSLTGKISADARTVPVLPPTN